MARMSGVLLLNLGGPDSPRAVRPFLYNLFSDRDIIRLGPYPFMQAPIAAFISLTRSGKSRKMYEQIGGKSPILETTLAQAAALEALLATGQGGPIKVYVGMRYWRPYIEEALLEAQKDGVQRLTALALYPHYSVATTGSSLSRLEKVAPKYGIKYQAAGHWFDHPLYIEALTETIRQGLDSFGDEKDSVPVLFSAHSLPQKFIDEGDPYVQEILGTIELVAKKLPMRWRLAYQSRSGPVKWLGPSTPEAIHSLAGQGVKRFLIVPISFVSDHVETLYEIDILYKDMAEGLGMEMQRAKALGTHPKFILALKVLVEAAQP